MTFRSVARAVARQAVVGLVAAVLAGVAGQAYVRSRTGSRSADTIDRVRAELTARFLSATTTLTTRAEELATVRDFLRPAPRDLATTRDLFAALDTVLPEGERARAGVTLFSTDATPIAWSGRVSNLPRERIAGPAALFTAVDALGPRLIMVRPIVDPQGAGGLRLGALVLEQHVDVGRGVSPVLSDRYTFVTPLADVTIRALPAPVATAPETSFLISAADGHTLAEADVSPDSVERARARWSERLRAVVFGVLAATLVWCTGPVLNWRRHAGTRSAMAAATVALLAFLVSARILLGIGLAPLPGASGAALRILPTALLAVVIVWLSHDLLERRRVAKPRPPLRAVPHVIRRTLSHFALAALITAMIAWYLRTLRAVAMESPFDLLRFSLHPIEAERLGVAFGLVLSHAAVIWGAAVLFALPGAWWRTRRSRAADLTVLAASALGIATGIGFLQRTTTPLPVGPLLTAVAAAAAAALALSRWRGRMRRASQSGRLGMSFLALLLPALALYPSLHAFTSAAEERLVEERFAPQAASQREDLQQRRMPNAIGAIAAMASLDEFVTSASEDEAPTTDRAFIVWSQTELATYRTTSAVELYGPTGSLVSRFALNLPDYAVGPFRGGSCNAWELYEETSPFGASVRNVLRASRAVCADGRRVGAVVVRAMLDYHALPFISPGNPYLEALAPRAAQPSETAFGRDVEFVVYGWSRAPLYSSGPSVWPVPDDVFRSMIASRQPRWASVRRADGLFRVYFFNDRGGIYALGHPVLSVLGHFVNLGELVFLTGVVYSVLVLGMSLFSALTIQVPASGRALLREVRSSFYRKLFLAFVAAAVIPVLVLAVATQRYLADQLRERIEEQAVETATVAQRLLEDYTALQARETSGLEVVDDQFMMLVQRAIDQDVNFFDGASLQATSERDLFASRILPSRTPSSIYRRLVLDRLPTSVAVEEIAGLPYLLAAAPVRSRGREGIVTVPQPLRSDEIEQQSDELNRRVLSASVLIVLFGAALGYWMAERIADPVSRLSRATRRIARGDFDARIAATSSDELRRLVEDFNSMAADLQRQRANLERTQRLEAWADMARQVAHDIKNPLTPIQLSAEHARRVNMDRGRPLSPVLDECVNAILSQVTLLRQIAAEFSNFASSPTARPESTDIGALVETVIAPYRSGLTGRVDVVAETTPGLPPVWVDPTLLSRALTNIIENALHAMPGGGRLTIATARDASGVRIAVQDTGVGMDAKALERIFEPYFSTKASGTGLGLTIAKRNVELSGGSIAVASERHVGTTVTIQLPFAPS